MVGLLGTLQLAIIFLAATNPVSAISCTDDDDPTTSAASIVQFNTTESIPQAKILDTRASSGTFEARQASCPNPSTNSLCPSNFCFIYEQNNVGGAWATCCPAGWFLQLNSADWTKQKCVLNGVSEPPVRPLSCGGSINGQTGTRSGWGCVYSNQNVNGAEKEQRSHLLAASLVLAWLGVWVRLMI
jgi:hypothetical protein